MEGPGGNPPRRRAGDSNTPGAPAPIKDWQRNTWYGPVPRDTNPFDEPDEAPELLELRSENVTQKAGEFWQDQKETTGYQSKALTSRQKAAGPRRKERKKNEGKLSRSLGRILLVMLLLAAVTGAVLYFGVYRVRVILVEGLTEGVSRIAPKDVVALSGIKLNDSMLGLDEKKVGETMISGARSKGQENQNYYGLRFRHMELKMPGTVILTVSERDVCCWVNLRGIIYVMDKEQTILWVTENKENTPIDLVQVKGLKVRNDHPQGGQVMDIESSEQKRIFRNLFLEMKVLDCMDLIQEIDLSNPGSVTMTTRKSMDPEGNEYVVSLGDCRSTDLSDPNTDRLRIHARLRSFMLVWDKLHNLNDAERENIVARIGHRINGGTIDVKTPETPYYSPDTEK